MISSPLQCSFEQRLDVPGGGQGVLDLPAGGLVWGEGGGRRGGREERGREGGEGEGDTLLQ